MEDTKEAKSLDTYRRPYRLRTSVPGSKSIEVTFPWEVVEREARKRGLTVKEFQERYQAIALFNGFEGVYYKFESINPSDEVPAIIKGESG